MDRSGVYLETENKGGSRYDVLIKKDVAVVEYSEGESGCEFDIPYKELKEKAKAARMLYHWRQVIRKSKAAANLKFRI